ncbi:unnamed protein product [Lupinus luteus]|uniref:Uncharacterized protein n=1 Tax=Lupinus luteus TaxID=3873 RepID=A0AAV1Y3J0_LUPLU
MLCESRFHQVVQTVKFLSVIHHRGLQVFKTSVLRHGSSMKAPMKRVIFLIIILRRKLQKEEEDNNRKV